MKRIVTFGIGLVILVCFIFSGCSEEIISSSEVNNDLSEAVSGNTDNNTNNDNITDASNEDTNANVYTKSLASGVKINAELNIPDNVDYTQLTEVAAKVKLLDYEKIEKDLMEGRKITRSDESFAADAFFADEPCRSESTDDRSTFAYTGEGIYFTTVLGETVNGVVNDNPISESYNGDLIAINPLSFMDSKTAFEKIKSRFAEFDINISDKYDCYSLTREDQAALPDNGVYQFRLYEDVFGVPITQYFTGSFNNGESTMGCDITATYSEDGIASMTLSRIYEYDNETKSDNSAHELDDAVNALDKRYSQIISNGSNEVFRIDLIYVPLATKEFNSFRLVPAWSFYIHHTEKTEDKSGHKIKIDRNQNILLNAIDLSEIISDNGGV